MRILEELVSSEPLLDAALVERAVRASRELALMLRALEQDPTLLADDGFFHAVAKLRDELRAQLEGNAATARADER
ncbi:MAG: hypothetical protein GWN37_16560 [Gammaproteobacteria bacterium]|nr:hypothetical protein [Gammaproteobacteria bacterium]